MHRLLKISANPFLLSIVVFSSVYTVFLSKTDTRQFRTNEAQDRSELIKFDLNQPKIALGTHFHYPKPCQNKYRLNGSSTTAAFFVHKAPAQRQSDGSIRSVGISRVVGHAGTQ